MEYPKYKYKKHESKPFVAKLVHDEEQEEALGEGWHDSPAEWHESAPAKKVVSEDDEDFEFPVPELKKRGRPAKAKE